MPYNNTTVCRILGVVVMLSTFVFAPAMFHSDTAMAQLSQEQLDRYNSMKATPPKKTTYLPNDFYECVLSEMQGVSQTPVANAVSNECRRQYPAIDNQEPPKSGGFFGRRPSPDKCFIKHAKNTDSSVALGRIRYACHQLYRDE